METYPSKDPHCDRVFHFTGGHDSGYESGYLDTIHRYNPSTDTWTRAGQLTEPKSYHASTTVADISQFDDICS